jgi:cysteinyl-tRNA synthetase
LRPTIKHLVLLLLGLTSCHKEEISIDYREEMRSFVKGISAWAKSRSPGFIVIPQNGHNLLTTDGTKDGSPVLSYINAIDGVGREDLFYGYSGDDEPTPEADKNEMLGLMEVARNHGLTVLAIDYCSTISKMDDSYQQNERRGYISFAADHRGLDNIPSYPSAPYNENSLLIDSLKKAKNFLYLIDPGEFPTPGSFVMAVNQSHYDVVIMDMDINELGSFTSQDIALMKQKINGGYRKVICYMSIGEAEDYRSYFKPYWKTTPPDFIVAEDPAWSGNYKVQYWNKRWQDIIYGNSNSYLQRIIDKGFDGVYLDIVDAYEFFEK